MSGTGIMGVREGCDVDGCSKLESDLCHEFSECLVRRAAGVIVGIKPGALFNYVPHLTCADACTDEVMCRKVAEVLDTYARELPCYGVRLVVLHSSQRKIALFAYRPELVGELLDDANARAFLSSAGYDTSSVRGTVGSLRERMHAYYDAAARQAPRPAYPHEVGLLLGYPLEDVRGFISGACETCRGPWKAYGEAHAAQERFGRLAMHEARCQAMYQGGSAFGELFGLGLAEGLPCSDVR